MVPMLLFSHSLVAILSVVYPIAGYPVFFLAITILVKSQFVNAVAVPTILEPLVLSSFFKTKATFFNA